MPNNTGTLVTSPIRPASTLDTFPVAFATEITGGLHSVTDVIARDAIATERRVEGMLVWVINEAKMYQLFGGTANANWKIFTLSNSNGSTIANWTASTTYNSNNIVIYNNNLYQAKIASTDAVFDPVKWQLITDMQKSVYDANANGIVDDAERLGGQLPAFYQKNIPIQSTAPLLPQTNDMWLDNSSSPYALKTWNGSIWVEAGIRAKLFTNLTDVPASYTGMGGKMVVVKSSETGLDFVSIPSARLDDWVTMKSYKLNDSVIESGKLYRCNTPHISNVFSTDITNWTLITDGIDTTSIKVGSNTLQSSSIELVSGKDITLTPDTVNNRIKIDAVSGIKLNNWTQSTIYAINDYVLFDNRMFKCLTAHTSSTVFDYIKWSAVNGSIHVNTELELPTVGVEGITYLVMKDSTSKDRPTQYAYSSADSTYYMIVDNTGAEIDDYNTAADTTWSSQNISNLLSQKIDINDSTIHMSDILGTKTLDETSIGDGKVISYNATSGKLEYITVAGAGIGSGGVNAPLSILIWHRESAPNTRVLPMRNFTVPQYTVGDHSLEVHVNGVLLSVEDDYTELSDTTIEFNYDIAVDQRVIFRCKAVNFISGGIF